MCIINKSDSNKNGVVFTTHTFLSAIPTSLNFVHVSHDHIHVAKLSHESSTCNCSLGVWPHTKDYDQLADHDKRHCNKSPIIWVMFKDVGMADRNVWVVKMTPFLFE